MGKEVKEKERDEVFVLKGKLTKFAELAQSHVILQRYRREKFRYAYFVVPFQISISTDADSLFAFEHLWQPVNRFSNID